MSDMTFYMGVWILLFGSFMLTLLGAIHRVDQTLNDILQELRKANQKPN